MLIQEKQQLEGINFTHKTTFATTTATKSTSCGSESFHMSKKTVRTVIMEDQMSTCSYGKKSVTKESDYSRGKKDQVKSSNMSDVSSIGEFQEMAFTLNGLGN